MIRTTDKYNLHTHSFYCRHGHGSIKEYSDEARRLGLDMLGFTEHMPLPDRRFAKTRMLNEEMDQYLDDIKKERKDDGLLILSGFECDYIPEFKSYFASYLEEGKVDYLINGVHFFKRNGEYVSPFDDVMERDDVYTYRDVLLSALDTGLFSFQAHPDLIFASYREWDDVSESVSREIIQFAIDRKIPLEVNGNGMLRPSPDDDYLYPRRMFWRLASEMGAYCVRNSDSHEVVNLGKTRELQESFVKECNVKKAYPIVKRGRLEFEF